MPSFASCRRRCSPRARLLSRCLLKKATSLGANGDSTTEPSARSRRNPSVVKLDAATQRKHERANHNGAAGKRLSASGHKPGEQRPQLSRTSRREGPKPTVIRGPRPKHVGKSGSSSEEVPDTSTSSKSYQAQPWPQRPLMGARRRTSPSRRVPGT